MSLEYGVVDPAANLKPAHPGKYPAGGTDAEKIAWNERNIACAQADKPRPAAQPKAEWLGEDKTVPRLLVDTGESVGAEVLEMAAVRSRR